MDLSSRALDGLDDVALKHDLIEGRGRQKKHPINSLKGGVERPGPTKIPFDDIYERVLQ